MLVCQIISLADSADGIPQPSDLAMVKEPRLLKAIETAKKSVKKAPREVVAWGKLGHVYLIHGWEAEAVACYRHAVEIDPTEFRWLYFLGQTTYRTHPNEAAGALRQAILLRPDYGPAHIYLAGALRSLGRFDQAKQHLTRAKKLDPKNPYAELWLGEIALAQKQFQTARTHLEQALDLNPGQSEAHAAMAQVALVLGDRKLANVHAEAARKPTTREEMDDPLWWEVLQAGATAELFIQRGHEYVRRGEYARAIEDLEPVLSVSEDNPDVWFDYGLCLFHTAHNPEALSAFARVLAILREMVHSERRTQVRAETHNYIGLIYQRMGHIDKAIAHFQATVDLVANNIEFRRNLADAYWSAKRHDEAAAEYQKFVEADPSDVQAHYRLGLARLTGERYDEALSHLEKVVKLNPTHVRAHGALGIIYDRMGRREDAIGEFETVLQLEPENPHARKMLEQSSR